MKRSMGCTGCASIIDGVDQLGLDDDIVDVPSKKKGNTKDDAVLVKRKEVKNPHKVNRDLPKKTSLKRKPTWACNLCTLINKSEAQSCEACGTPADTGGTTSGTKRNLPSWGCPKCSYINPQNLSTCSMCKYKEVIVLD